MLNVDPDISDSTALAICWPGLDAAGLAAAGGGLDWLTVFCCWVAHAAEAALEPEPPTRIPISILPNGMLMTHRSTRTTGR